MALFVIDESKCKRDGHCAAVCPSKIIVIKKGAFPGPAANAEESCIECGHCVAVCPHGALAHRRMGPADCLPLKRELLPGPEQVEQWLRSRRSVRVFEDAPVEREKMEALIKVARHAPTGHNSQPVEWLVIRDKEEVHKLAGLTVEWIKNVIKLDPALAEMMHLTNIVLAWRFGIDVVLRNAPNLILTHAPRDHRAAPTACTIALAYLELAAPSFGLGACWAGFFSAAALSYPPLQEALALPAGDLCFGAMMLGQPKYQYHRLPVRNEPKITWR
jgi:nitroreductase/NAD-dependent dihydropyrimidine dehydrogenase PreA subunit